MKIICVGRNYLNHAKELNNPIPDSPFFFIKPETAIIKNNKPFIYPEFSKNIHYEVEIIIRISKTGKNIKLEEAEIYYQKIGLGIDFTARDIQDLHKKKGYPWEQAKAFDGSAALSKFISKEKLPNINSINFYLELNKKTVQKGNSQNLIFPINKLIAEASRFFTLEKGDIIFTGTPEGVGAVKKGDKLTAYLEDKKMLDFFIE